jgi:hypothetical protein
MDTSQNPCPRCHEPLSTVLAHCFSWQPADSGQSFLVLGLETLYRCTPCAEVYFSEEVCGAADEAAA